MGERLGSLNLYSRVGRAFSEFDAALLRVYASLIASTIRLARDGREAREEAAGLIKAMESRSIIEQAKGIVMATGGGVSADEAFDFLVVSSQQRNIKLARLAKELVDLTSGADGVKAIARTRDYSRSRQGTSILTSSSCPDATTARLPGYAHSRRSRPQGMWGGACGRRVGEGLLNRGALSLNSSIRALIS